MHHLSSISPSIQIFQCCAHQYGFIGRDTSSNPSMPNVPGFARLIDVFMTLTFVKWCGAKWVRYWRSEQISPVCRFLSYCSLGVDIVFSCAKFLCMLRTNDSHVNVAFTPPFVLATPRPASPTFVRLSILYVCPDHDSTLSTHMTFPSNTIQDHGPNFFAAKSLHG